MQSIEQLFGQAVRCRRNQLGLSQEAFAEKAGIHRTYVSSIELGKVQVSIGIAQQLARALEMPLSRLWKDVEQNLPHPARGGKAANRTSRSAGP